MSISMLLKILLSSIRNLILRLPQTPRKRPYPQREVSIATNDPDVVLAGELALPDEAHLHPGIVLLTGSGQHTRDEPVAGHRWFLVLADHLTRNGYAVLRCDDRGAGKSTGNFQVATLQDYADDAAHMIEFLRTQPNVDPERCGFMGHSEGGYTAPLAATKCRVDFIVMLAGGVLPLLPDTLTRQYSDIMRADGKSDSEIEKAVGQVHESSTILRESTTSEEASASLTSYLESESLKKRHIRTNVGFFAKSPGDSITRNTIHDLRSSNTRVPCSRSLAAAIFRFMPKATPKLLVRSLRIRHRRF